MAAFLHRNMVPCHPTSSLCFSTGRCGGAVIHPATFPFQGNASLRLWQVHSLKKQLLRKTQPPAICLCGPVSPAPGISSPSPEIGGGGGHGGVRHCRLRVRMAGSWDRAGIQTMVVALACPRHGCASLGSAVPD